MSRIQQDQFIDEDEDETCPLCVEEFDLSDKNFRPCPCGYQICQFCFNNIKTTMNGLCPACRRPYDDKTIEWKMISPEEMANYKADLAQQQKKKAAARQKEAQKREADSLGRKHLAGLRVVQKNLVYVTGLSPKIREDQLLQTLRGDQYFGQYGKIIKIVVSKAKETSHGQQSVGVYVTFARKEDAASCIAAVDGSQNGDRTLRAQYGTTKYCSIYLRGEQCNNRNCMFLHEPGEENDSFTRQDLSSMNVISTQQPAQAHASSISNQAPQPQPPPQQAPQKIAAASQAMQRSDSTEVPPSPAGSGDGSALPSTASWADQRTSTQQGRKTNAGPSGAAPSPCPPNSQAVVPHPEVKENEAGAGKSAEHNAKAMPPPPLPVQRPAERPTHSTPSSHLRQASIWDSLLKAAASPQFRFSFSIDGMDPDDLKLITNFPLLLDPNGGENRRLQREREEDERRRRREVAAQTVRQAASPTEPEGNLEAGSFQLGGEPDERSLPGATREQQLRSAIQPPSQQSFDQSEFGPSQNLPMSNDLATGSLSGRGLNSQQPQQQLLQHFKTSVPQHANPVGQVQGHQGLPSQSGAFQGNFQQPGATPGHARQMSKFSFANDTASASAAVKPVANTKLMSQQSSMMPPSTANQYNSVAPHPQLGGQFYSGGVQGPPPGLKATRTPPVSGGGMFGQGHGFATSGLGYGANAAGRNTHDDLMRELMRGRGANLSGGQVSDAGKREFNSPSFFHQPSQPNNPAPTPGLFSFPFGLQPGMLQDYGPLRQKKKGKKHKHANTSSFGGGVVDVADPSILQARIHQGGVAAGQGFYGGQGQGGFNSMMYNGGGGAAYVHQGLLSSDGADQDVVAPAPPSSSNATSFATNLTQEPRQFTPALPPGLPLPHGHPQPPDTHGQSLPSKAHHSRHSSAILPVNSSPLPIFQHGSIPVEHGLGPPSSSLGVVSLEALSAETADRSAEVEEEKNLIPVAKSTVPELPVSVVKGPSVVANRSPRVIDENAGAPNRNIQANQDHSSEQKDSYPSYADTDLLQKVSPGKATANTGESERKRGTKSASQSLFVPRASQVPLVGEQDVAEEPTSAAEQQETTKPGAKDPRLIVQPSIKQAGPPLYEGGIGLVESISSHGNSTQSTKRQHPGKLDIAAATGSTTDEPGSPSPSLSPSKLETPIKPARPPSLAATPRAATDSPAKRQQPRTLRVVATPRAETPPPPSLHATVTSSTALPLAAASKPASRHQSIASFNPPGTPASEAVSDNASLASASVSRGGSPPPTRIGAVSVRAKTKSQQKKERQERAKGLEEDMLAAELEKPPTEESLQAPIIGRKKKTKKPTASTNASSIPASSTPASPKDKGLAVADKEPEQLVSEANPRVTKSTKANVSDESFNAPSGSIEPTPKLEITPASLLAELKRTEELFAAALELFKPVSGLTNRHDINQADISNWSKQPTLDEKDREKLTSGEAVRKGGDDDRTSSNVLISPSRVVLRGLTREQEKKFLELEKWVSEDRSQFRYTPRKAAVGISTSAPQPDLTNQLFNEPAPISPRTSSAAIPKVNVDETLHYLNQFVLPTLSGVVPQIGKLAQETARAAFGSSVGVGAAEPNMGNWTDVGLTASLASEGHGASALAGQSVQDIEGMFIRQKREAEALEKKLNALIKRNKRLALGTGH